MSERNAGVWASIAGVGERITAAWARVLGAALGLWLMAAPAVLGYGNLAAENARVVGALAFSVSFVTSWEIARPLRWATLPLGAWLVVSPWVLGYADGSLLVTVNTVVGGVLLAAVAFVPGRHTQEYGGGWLTVWTGDVPRDADEEDDAGTGTSSDI